MIVKPEIVEKIRTRINSLISTSGLRAFIGKATQEEQALVVAVREAFSAVQEAMDLSEEEELFVQGVETKPANGQMESNAQTAELLKLIRTRHAKRVIFKSPGQTLHEAFHTKLKELGESKYGNGCWKDLSQSRKDAWEAASVALANGVVLNTVQLKPTVRPPFGSTLRPSFYR